MSGIARTSAVQITNIGCGSIINIYDVYIVPHVRQQQAPSSGGPNVSHLIMSPVPHPKMFFQGPLQSLPFRYLMHHPPPPPLPQMHHHHHHHPPMGRSTYIPMNQPPPPGVPRFCYYDYLVVVDFEATCDDNRDSQAELRPLRLNERPEIIQFPAVLISVRSGCIVDTFNTYVRPVERPQLSAFCTDLTGITQEQVDNAPTFPEALELFEQWLAKYQLHKFAMGRSFAIVTDGSYDIGHFLYKQCVISSLPFPEYVHNWVDIRQSFRKFFGRQWHSLHAALRIMGDEFEGRHHNGLDDAKNIAKVTLRLLSGGVLITASSKMVFCPDEQLRNERLILNDKHSKKYDLATVKPVAIGECLYFVSPGVMAGCVPANELKDYPLAENLVEVSEYEYTQAANNLCLAKEGKKKTVKKTHTVEKRGAPKASKTRLISSSSVTEE